MTRVIKGQIVALLALMTALVLTLAACGGGGSSAGGGSSGGASVAGTVGDGFAAVEPAGQASSLLVALGEMVVESAQAAGVAGVTVELISSTGAVVGTQVTNADGRFIFSGLAPDSYSLRLSQNGTALGQTPTIQVDPATRTEIEMSLQGAITEVDVTASGDTISGQVEDDSSFDDDDLSSDDDASMDDDDSVDDDDSDDDDSQAGSTST